MRTILNLVAFLSIHAGAREWPATYSPGPAQAQYLALEKEGAFFRYRTKNYLIESTLPLRGHPMEEFVRSIESVAAVIKSVPLPLSWPSGDAHKKITICQNEEAFMAAGGSKNTAGFYHGSREIILIRHDQFFLSEAHTSRLTPKRNYDLLVHELVHLHMHGYLGRTMPWFYEGVAEYFAAAHGKSGHYDFSNIEREIRRRIVQHRDPEETSLQLTALSPLLTFDPKRWRERLRNSNLYEVFEDYHSSLILVHYFFHGGEERRLQVRQFLEASAEITHKRENKPILLPVKEAPAIEKKLRHFWKSRGLNLQFRKKF